MIKDQMDKKFGAPWHVVVGKGFSYEITSEVSLNCIIKISVCIGALNLDPNRSIPLKYNL
jgi:hypothetical protein